MKIKKVWTLRKNGDNFYSFFTQLFFSGSNWIPQLVQPIKINMLTLIFMSGLTSTMWTIPRWGSSGDEYSLSMNTRVIWFPCRITHKSCSIECAVTWFCLFRTLSLAWFWLFGTSCVTWFWLLGTQGSVWHLQDDVRSGGLSRQRQHVSSHGLSV